MKSADEITPQEIDRPSMDSTVKGAVKNAEAGNRANVKAHLTSRLAALVGALALGVLYLFLPDKLIIGPSWLLLVVEVPLILPLLLSFTTRRMLPHFVIRTLALILLVVTTLALAIGIFLLVYTLKGEKGDFLLRSAGILWVFNILVFSLWYFEIDGGGPLKRHLAAPQASDLLFPQYVSGLDKSWKPLFVDYIFLAFTSATALSPADTQPLTQRTKILMMLEAVFSLVVIVLLAARAVNILG
jgi:hypothetical protein